MFWGNKCKIIMPKCYVYFVNKFLGQIRDGHTHFKKAQLFSIQ
ncbi:hypothetical protein FSS13T_26290 [Flavobacterium saliperosum S13]|uniref:Uncharacterized protein n=1 Tax=Flavobacterium saliperosum S13 TaxID=1341155 RepID=A0ABP2ZU72_9FLAO|nr:hypothetical protein FSS13T_26290 [Flavobacterium saliperosum S13]